MGKKKKVRKYLESLGWKRYKEYEEGYGDKHYILSLEDGSEYQISFELDSIGWLFTDDSDELDIGIRALTMEDIDCFYNEFINDRIKSY
jgi:hypothetical protein